MSENSEIDYRGLLAVGSQLIRSWSSTQAVVALSSGEAELYGTIRASQEGLGYRSLAKDLGADVQVRVATDSSAALGVIRREGLGKLRHLETTFLWVQDVAASNKIEYAKEARSSNPADVCTKHTPRELIERHCKYMKFLISLRQSETGL